MSNIQPHDRIMLVDGQTKFNLEHNPSLEKLFRNDFKICQINDLTGNEVVRIDHHEIKISESGNSGYYAPSILYKNLYYPLERYSEMHQKDLEDIIVGLAARMGAKNILYSRLAGEYQVDTDKVETQFKVAVDLRAVASLASLFGNFQGLGFINKVLDEWTEPLPLEINKTKSQQNTKEERSLHNSTQKHSNLSYDPKSKEELHAWIAQKGINIEALPSSFLLHVEQYLEGGKISGVTISCEDDISHVTTKNAELSSTLSITLPMLPNFIVGTLNNQTKGEYYYVLKTKYEIEF
ncbi:MAG: hypothetical protein HDT12_00935 [Helicobacter sp.]|nr:hypothetical protein [Helicobacter sp.]